MAEVITQYVSININIRRITVVDCEESQVRVGVKVGEGRAAVLVGFLIT